MRRIHKTVSVPASRAELWQAWTTSEGLASFFAEVNWVELRIGGAFEMYFLTDGPRGSQGSEGCRVLSYVPERMLSFSWNAPPHLPSVRREHTWVTLFFEEEGAGSRLELLHLGWGEGEDWDAAHAYFDRAWGLVLDRLVERFGARPGRIDAAFLGQDGRAYLFGGGRYWSAPGRSPLTPEAPARRISEDWGGLRAVRAALRRRDQVILVGDRGEDPRLPSEGEDFDGPTVLRGRDAVQEVWNLPQELLDAGFAEPTAALSFEDRIVLVASAEAIVFDPGSARWSEPRRVDALWPGLPFAGVTAGFVDPEGGAWLFSEEEEQRVVRCSPGAKGPDPGFPRGLREAWGRLPE